MEKQEDHKNFSKGISPCKFTHWLLLLHPPIKISGRIKRSRIKFGTLKPGKLVLKFFDWRTDWNPGGDLHYILCMRVYFLGVDLFLQVLHSKVSTKRLWNTSVFWRSENLSVQRSSCSDGQRTKFVTYNVTTTTNSAELTDRNSQLLDVPTAMILRCIHYKVIFNDNIRKCASKATHFNFQVCQIEKRNENVHRSET